LGQTVDQGINALAGGAQARLEQVALQGDLLDLLAEQGIGALEFFVAHEQTLDAFGNLINQRLVWHKRGILR
jgi:hypothetical protein